MATAAISRTGRTVQAVRYWMTMPAISIGADEPVSEALALMHEHSIRRLPVVDSAGKLRGIITDGDIRGADVMRAAGMETRAVADALRRTQVCELMTEQPIVVGEDTALREVALLMLDNKVGGLPVVDAQANVVGMITESDLFEALVCYLDRAADSV